MKTKTMAQTAIALTIACIIAVLVVLGIFGNSQCWFGHKYDKAGVCVRCGDAKEIKPEEEKPLANGGMAVSGISNGRNIRLGVRRAAQTASGENTYDLTATITPATADNKNVTWAVAWKNANSTFAKGKTVTDYVTVAAAADNQLKATVTCKQAFGEQVIVKVTSVQNANATASCNVDYVERITGINISLPKLTGTSTTMTYNFETTPHTIDATLALNIESDMVLTDGFFDMFDMYLDSSGEYDHMRIVSAKIARSGNALTLSPNFATGSGDIVNGNFVVDQNLRASGVAGCFLAFENMSQAEFGRIEPLVQDALFNGIDAAHDNSIIDHATFNISFTSTYNGKTYSSGTKTVGVQFDQASIHVGVSSVSLSDGSIIF